MDRKRRHNDYEDRRHDSQQQHHHHHKKSKHGNRRDDGGDNNNNNTHSRPRPPEPSTAPYEQAIAALPPPTTAAALPPVPAYTPFTVPTDTLPPLPPILDPALATAPFRHKSTSAAYNRSASTSVTTTYEHLEFLGDAQLEHLASRLLFARFPHLTAGQQSQLRELLVKNETLAEYARAYGLDERVSVGDRERMEADAGKAGNKGFNKVLGDVFEAYVAAVILSHGDEGFAVAEKWMLGLWAPKLLEAAERERYWSPGVTLTHAGTAEEDGGEGWRKVYNPAAKAELQKLILSGRHVRLDYERYRDSVELKGERLGQSRHFIAVYLTGYGYERKLLGKGEGKNKVEAGNWAAQEALHGECKGVVEECAKILESKREERRRELEVAAEKEAAAEEQEGEEPLPVAHFDHLLAPKHCCKASVAPLMDCEDGGAIAARPSLPTRWRNSSAKRAEGTPGGLRTMKSKIAQHPNAISLLACHAILDINGKPMCELSTPYCELGDRGTSVDRWWSVKGRTTQDIPSIFDFRCAASVLIEELAFSLWEGIFTDPVTGADFFNGGPARPHCSIKPAEILLRRPAHPFGAWDDGHCARGLGYGVRCAWE